MNLIWQVMKQADLGIADAYINGDFSFIDKDKGLLNLFMVRGRFVQSHSCTLQGLIKFVLWFHFQLLIANGDSNYAASKMNTKRCNVIVLNLYCDMANTSQSGIIIYYWFYTFIQWMVEAAIFHSQCSLGEIFLWCFKEK